MLRLDSVNSVSRILLLCLLLVPGVAVFSNEKEVSSKSGLFLFLSEEEQLAAESLKASTSGKGVDAPLDTDPTGLNNKPDETESVSELSDFDKQNVSPDATAVLYNGAVLKGKEVIGLWVNGEQFIGSDCLRVERVDRYGVVRLSGKSDSIKLRPGHKISESEKLALMTVDGESLCSQ